MAAQLSDRPAVRTSAHSPSAPECIRQACASLGLQAEHTQLIATVLAAALEPLCREIAEQREALEHLERRALAATDRRDLSVLLPAARDLLGTAVWTVPEFVARASTATNPALHQLMNDLAEEHEGDGWMRALGKQFARLAGASAGGLRLLRIAGKERDWGSYTIKAIRR